MQDCVVSVVGLSNNEKEPFATRPGVGKSCFCFRLAYPGFDSYVSDHPSLLALHEFENPVINNSHFVYWGSPVKTFPSTVKGGEVSVRFHLLEQTVFYQDVTSHPFNSVTKPDNVDHYIRRIIGPIESSGKHSYYSRDDIYSSPRYTKFQYPANLTKKPRGFVVVFDVSLSDADLEMQCKRVEPVLESLCKAKKKVVIAATKRDCHKLMSLQKAQELHKKFRVPLIETSANENLNEEEVLRVLVKLLLGKKVPGLSDQVQKYDEAARGNLIQRGSAKRAFTSFLKKRITDSNETMASIAQTEEFKECVKWIGMNHCGSLFAQHVLELFNTKVDTYAGVDSNPSLRQEFLEDFVDSRFDLDSHKLKLRSWIDTYIKQLEEALPPSDSAASSSNSQASNEATANPYQFFSKDVKPPANGLTGSSPLASNQSSPQASRSVSAGQGSPQASRGVSAGQSSPQASRGVSASQSSPQASRGVPAGQSSPQASKVAKESEFGTISHGSYRPPLPPSDKDSGPTEKLSEKKADLSSSSESLDDDHEYINYDPSKPPSFATPTSIPPRTTNDPVAAPPPTPREGEVGKGKADGQEVGKGEGDRQEVGKGEVDRQEVKKEVEDDQEEEDDLDYVNIVETLSSIAAEGKEESIKTQLPPTQLKEEDNEAPKVLPKPSKRQQQQDEQQQEQQQQQQQDSSSNPPNDPLPKKPPPPPTRSPSTTLSAPNSPLLLGGRGTTVDRGESTGATRVQRGLSIKQRAMQLEQVRKGDEASPGVSTAEEDGAIGGRNPQKERRVSEGCESAGATSPILSGGTYPRTKVNRAGLPPLASKPTGAGTPPKLISPSASGNFAELEIFSQKPAPLTTAAVATPNPPPSSKMPPSPLHSRPQQAGTVAAAAAVLGGVGGVSQATTTGLPREQHDATPTEDGKVNRPMLSRIKERIAEKKEMESEKRVEPLSPPPGEPAASDEAQGTGTLNRLEMIRRRLAEKKLVSPPGSPQRAGSPPPATLPKPSKSHSQSIDEDDSPALPLRTPPSVQELTSPATSSPTPHRSKQRQKQFEFVTLPNRRPEEGTSEEVPAQKPSVAQRRKDYPIVELKSAPKNTEDLSEKKKKYPRVSIFNRGKDKSASSNPQRSGEESPVKSGSPLKKLLSPLRKSSPHPKDTDSVDSDPSSSDATPSSVSSPVKNVSMKERPLPSLPGHTSSSSLPDHSEDDYEKIIVDDMYINYPKLPEMVTKPPPSVEREERSAIGGNIKKWNSLGGRDVPRVNRPPIPLPPRRDDDPLEYVNADDLPPQNFSTMPRVKNREDEEDDDLTYDYPDIRKAMIFRNEKMRANFVERVRQRVREGKRIDGDIDNIIDMFPSSSKAKDQLLRLKNENMEHGIGNRNRTLSNASSDYVHMDSVDDTYINYNNSEWVPRCRRLPPRDQSKLASATTSSASQESPGEITREKPVHYASDDWTEYVNYHPTDDKRPSLPLPSRGDSKETTIPPRTHSVAHPSNPPPVATKPKPTVSRGASSEDPGAPPTTLPKPQRSKPRSATVMATSWKSGEEATPHQGWKSPPPLTNQDVPEQPDYQGVDPSQSLPMKALKSIRLPDRRHSEDAALPPRHILRNPNPN